MYAPRLIQQKLSAFSAREGWEPEEHTIAEVQEFSEYVKSVSKVDENSKSGHVMITKGLKESRVKEIRRFVQNEQVMCAVNANYWETRYAYICDEKGEIFKFKNRVSQDVFDNIIAEFEDREVAIELFCLKGRQVGISTKTALKFLHRMLFMPNTQAVMASVQAEKSELIGRILNICLERCPWWLIPMLTTDRVGKMKGFDNGSILSIQSGSQATGIAQGWTPTLVHVCLTPNTLVRVGNGFLKPIADVSPGDFAITKEGSVCKVRAVVKSARRHEISRELWLWGGFAPLGTTLDHPVFTNRGWRPAGEIKTGDSVRHPVRPITRTIERFRGSHIKRSKHFKTSGSRFWVNLNPAWGYICGLYLAEGSCQSNVRFHTENAKATALVFSIHENEIDAVSERVREAFGKDQYFNVHVRKDSFSAKITVNVAHLARWMALHFGMKDEKQIPDWVWSAGREFCLQLVKGYLDGDGHYVKGHNEITAPSIRVQLPVQIRDLVASLGFGWSSIHYRSAGVYYERNCRAQWTIALHGTCGKAFREHFGLPSYESTEALHWRYDLLKENIDIDVENTGDGFSETFYDLEVEHESHSFVTAQCAVKNSEVGDIPNPKKVIEEGLLRATHSSRKLFLILEGTGNGNTGWQADKWRALKEDYPRGLARLCPMFLSWPLATDLYPEADWLRAHPIPEAWQPINETVKHVRRCEMFIRSTDYLSKICGPEWQMPRRQQWFWEFNYREAVKSHTQRIWMSQMPADDFEALTGKNDMVFDQEVIHVRSKERAKNYKAYAVTGNSIDEGFEPDPSIIDYDTERIHIHWDSNRGNSFDWILIPLKPFDETEHRNVLDKLLVYEEPKEGRDYAIGIDTADGYGKEEDDRAVMSVAQSAKGNYPDIQVAEFVSNRVNPAQMVGWAAAMGAWYGKVARNPRGAKFCIEQRERPGDDCQYQLKLMGFNYHHEMVYYDDKRPKEGSGYKHGWSTNSQSRPILMNTFIDAVTNGWYKANSLWLLAECKDLERKVSAVGKTKVEHQSGKHDDRVFGAALSYITSHHMDIHRDRSKKQYAVNAGKPPDIDMSHARVSEMSVGD